MKNFKTALALITAALVALALFATPTSGISLASASPTGDDDGANLELRPPGGSYDTGTTIEILANFQSATAGQEVTLWRETTPGSGTYEIAEVDTSANSSGNAYFHPTIQNGAVKYFAEDESLRQTEVVPITGNTPVPQNGVLNAPTNNGKTWTSKFTPGVNGKSVELQIQRIYTHEVSDVDAVDPSVSKTKRVGPWKTIATGTQNASGDTSFTLASPYPYRVPHRYRVISGSAKSCEQTDNSAATTCQVFGLPLTTPKNSGLSAVYFNTNEGQAVDTRTRYFEGEFRMSADTKGLGCTDLGVADPTKQVKLSVMKGRGNYSWSFKRKSYTLKLGSDKNLCGMGENNKWALVSQDYDKALARNALAQHIGSKFTNMKWTPKSVPVDFYLNGKYLGNYMLVERISIDGDRVDIDELKGGEPCGDIAETPEDQVGDPDHPLNNQPCITGGYVLEWDFRKGGDRNVTVDGRGFVGVKDPEFDRDRENAITKAGITSQQLSYIDNYLNQADNAVANAAGNNNNWQNFIDMDSAVDYYLAMEYMKPVDGNMWASVYMYKPRGEKIQFGPMWDFDLAAGSANRAGNVISSSGWYLRDNLQVSAMHPECSSCTKYNTWFNQLNKNSSFQAAKKARWNQVEGSLGVAPFLDAHKAAIATSAAQTQASSGPAPHSYRISQYQTIKSDFNADFKYLRDWATQRRAWMNGQF